jgi:hypothetical protein
MVKGDYLVAILCHVVQQTPEVQEGTADHADCLLRERKSGTPEKEIIWDRAVISWKEVGWGGVHTRASDRET